MKTVVVTGATSGIGFAVCEELLKNGCRVIGLGHSKTNCRSAREKLLEVNPSYDVTYLWGDLMQQAEVVRLAGRIKSDHLRNNEGKLDALINNAGCVRSWYMTTGEGYEQQFALNHLAGFLLTHELFVNLIKGGGCILFTSSNSHKMMKMNWKDLMFEKRYRPLFVYKQSKLCNMLTALELNARYAGQDIRAYGVDPGLVRTQIGCKNTGKLVAKSDGRGSSILFGSAAAGTASTRRYRQRSMPALYAPNQNPRAFITVLMALIDTAGK